MTEWLYEAGIGEVRAALIHDGAVVEARIELDDTIPRAGAILAGRLINAREGRVALEDGGEAVLSAASPVSEGCALTVEIVREAIAERGRIKPARAISVEANPAAAPSLLARITKTGISVRTLRAHEPDVLEAAGWSEILEEARTGDIAFPGGMLRMIPTPAMTLFDVDGSGALELLAISAAKAVAGAIRRHDITGSIGVDFPTLSSKGSRHVVAAALDAGLSGIGPFERTTVNGFGFLQIVRRRIRASLPELITSDPIGADARALLRSIERTPPPIPSRITARPAVVARLASRPDWIGTLSRRTGIVPIFEVS